MNAVPQQSSWAEDMQRLHDEAAGVLALQVVQQSDMPDLLLDVACGSSQAQQVLGLVGKTLARIEMAPRKKSMLCGCCPKPIRSGGRFSLVIAWPGVDEPARGLVLAICHRCGSDHTTIQGKAVERLYASPRPRFENLCPVFSRIEGRFPQFDGFVPLDLALAMLVAGEA